MSDFELMNAIHDAILERNISKLENLIKKKEDVDLVDRWGNTPLHIAVRGRRNKRVVQFLLDHQAQVNVKNTEHGETPLHIAATSSLEIAEMLIENGADIHIQDLYGRTPLDRTAVSSNNLNTAKLLIERGAKINVKDIDGKTVLHVASTLAYEITKLLIKHGVNPNVKGLSEIRPLHFAVEVENNMENVKLLIDSGADINAKDKFGLTPFLRACAWEGDLEIVKFLHRTGIDMNARDQLGEGPLHRSIWGGDKTDIIEFLLDNGADINELTNDFKTPLYQSINLGKVNKTKILLENDADVDFSPNVIGKLDSKSKHVEPRVKETIKTVQEHLVKQRALKLVGEKILENWNEPKIYYTPKFVEDCEQEVKLLREMICGERNVRYLDLLVKNFHAVAVYLNVDEINEILNEVNFEEKFPIYASMLRVKIKKCTDLAKFLKQGHRSLQFVLEEFQVPDAVILQILTFLNEDDLTVLNTIALSEQNV